MQYSRVITILSILLFVQSCADPPSGASSFTVLLEQVRLVDVSTVQKRYDSHPYIAIRRDFPVLLRFITFCEDENNAKNINYPYCKTWGRQVYDGLTTQEDKYLAFDLVADRNITNVYPEYQSFIDNCFSIDNRGEYKNIASLPIFNTYDVHHMTLYISLPHYRGIIPGASPITNPVNSNYCIHMNLGDKGYVKIPPPRLQRVIDEYDCGLSTEIRKKLTSKRDNYTEVCKQFE